MIHPFRFLERQKSGVDSGKITSTSIFDLHICTCVRISIRFSGSVERPILRRHPTPFPVVGARINQDLHIFPRAAEPKSLSSEEKSTQPQKHFEELPAAKKRKERPSPHSRATHQAIIVYRRSTRNYGSNLW